LGIENRLLVPQSSRAFIRFAPRGVLEIETRFQQEPLQRFAGRVERMCGVNITYLVLRRCRGRHEKSTVLQSPCEAGTERCESLHVDALALWGVGGYCQDTVRGSLPTHNIFHASGFSFLQADEPQSPTSNNTLTCQEGCRLVPYVQTSSGG
jgi:hypothetical protein